MVYHSLQAGLVYGYCQGKVDGDEPGEAFTGLYKNRA